MQFLILIAAEVISTIVIIGASTTKTLNYKAFGIQIAQAQTTSPDTTSAPSTTDNSAPPPPPPADNSQPPPATTSQPAASSAPSTTDNSAPPPPPPADNSQPPPATTSQPAASSNPPEAITPPPSPGDPFAATSPDQYPANPVEAAPTSPNSSAAPSVGGAESPTPTQSPNAQTSTVSSPTPIGSQVSTLSSPSPTEAQASAAPSSTSETLNPIDYTPSQTAALVDPTQLLSSPENIPEDTTNKIKNEEKKIENTQTPSQKANVLLDLVQDKVTQIAKSSDQNDFASANLNTLRLTEQVQQVQNILTSLPPSQSQPVAQKLQNFCKRTDFSLKSDQLAMPEEAEQDVEIARGACLSTSL